ncbi:MULTISPECIES: hypothetical protein [unclassified Treponema]|uniref:hypothetical protein n=1 Tax=unclassified Treponema TaxID=2638727 RepID=UPI0020A2B8BA|nr:MULTISPECIES: hypothetical protein [unclassified Treponema]UTC66674.1 hypothetical protein E4O06_12055 [Treponema sp. OMZ 789]UTC69406.1 hypothetical protein E4O01_12195 [Treponema sp. OMZ 790]UTC72120.1 hypothetical protein E4O02_12290 [Treponema sp. OMZ 791]
MTEIITPPATIELLSRGMECLVESMGVVEAEYFIAAVRRERFDYTKWQREYFDKMDLETFVNNAKIYTQSVRK